MLPAIPGEGTAAYLALCYSHPVWLVNRLIAETGYEHTKAFLAENNQVAPVTIHVNTLKISAEAYRDMLLEEGISFDDSGILPDCFSLHAGSVNTLPGYKEGLFYVQDLAARLAVDIAEPAPGMQVMDACAAPGGKSLATAIAMRDEGRLLSFDLHNRKLATLRENAQRLGIHCMEAAVRDARLDAAEYHNAFDLVLADVPCSGFGVIRKRPEIRYKTEEEIAGLPEIQKAILENLSYFVRPGGCLLYSTCTVLRAENQDIIQWFLQGHPNYNVEDFSLPSIRAADGVYTFWPQQDHTDGFFVAKLRKKHNTP